MSGLAKIFPSRVYAFNKDIQELLRSRVPCPENHREAWLLCDCSHSMNAPEIARESKLVLSCLNAITGGEKIPALPAPSGGTNIIGAAEALKEELMAYDENHRPSILLITDGCDTNHATKIITVGIDDDGNPITRDLRDTAAIEASGQTYQEARAEAVLMFLTNVIKAHTFVVGIGNLCSDILNVAKRLPIVAARLNGDSTPAQAYAVMRKTLNTAPPARGTTTPTIELASLAADEAPEALTDPADAALIAAAAANYRKITYGAVLTAEELYDSWLAAEALAGPTDAHRGAVDNDAYLAYTRREVLFLIGEADKAGYQLAGAWLHAQHDALFDPPDNVPTPAHKTYINKLLHQLTKAGILSVTKKVTGHCEPAHWVREGEKARTKNGVDTFAASRAVEHVIDELEDNRTFAFDQTRQEARVWRIAAQAELKVHARKSAGKKRKAAEAEDADAADAAAAQSPAKVANTAESNEA